MDLLGGRPLAEVELLATVQYSWCTLVAGGCEASDEEVTEYIQEWSKEKRDKFPPSSVRQALSILEERGWLGPMGEGRSSPLIDPVPEVGRAVLQ